MPPWRALPDAACLSYGRRAYLYDIQVAYCTKRDQTFYRGRDRFVKGLKSAFEDCPGLSYETRRELEETKTNGIARFAPEKGGSYAVWILWKETDGPGAHPLRSRRCTLLAHDV